jgi:hypothetical protein
MTKLDVFDIVGNGVEALGLRHHLLPRHKHELGILIDELLDKPRAGDAIDFDPLAGDPFHAESPLQCVFAHASGVREDENSAMRG